MARKAIADFRSKVRARELADLHGVGPAILGDFHALGIRTVKQLARRDAHALYQRLCAITGKRLDPCVRDVFSAAIAQARDPRLEAERCCWWYWSRVRKNEAGKRSA